MELGTASGHDGRAHLVNDHSLIDLEELYAWLHTFEGNYSAFPLPFLPN